MNMSIRNQLAGTVTNVTTGEAMAAVKSRLTGGQVITAAITHAAVDELGITAGSAVQVLIKATEVALATEPVTGVSIRNQIPGEVTAIVPGRAMATVTVSVEGAELTAAITNEAVTDLGLAVGTPVVALIKSTEISLATV
jgi:molybdate transport system regulatory protein